MCKENYRPISLLPAISKLFERLIYTQLYDYMRQFFSPLLGGLRQGYSTQHVLLNFLQRCKSSIDNKGLAGALFTVLSKAFDSVDHNLQLAKLNAYCINLDALQLLRSYLSKRHQRVKVNSTFSDWKEIRFGVPQRSVLGPLIFNVFVNDIFLFVRCTNICNYADDTTIFACHPTLETIIRQLETDGTLVAKWFSDKYLKLNDDKCHLMMFGNKCSKATVTIRSTTIMESGYEKLLGITFDKKLSFRKHNEDLCKKATQKLHALARLSTYIDLLKLEILINSFIKSQFNYFPLVWMFHDKVLNPKLNLIQKRALRLVCKGSETECENLMKRTVTTHQHNLPLLMIEIYKTKHSLNPTFMRGVFAERNNQHDLRNENHLRLPVAKTTTYGLETIKYRGCLLWSTLPPENKDSKSLSKLKRKIKKFDGNSCVCRLCNIYFRNLGFL